MDTDNHLYVDGPINAFRLEGMVDGVAKSVYLFADYHFDVDLQTKCATYDSVPISNFIYKKMKELSGSDKGTKLKYDLFGEMSADEFADPSIDSHQNTSYIDNYMMMLRMIQYQKSAEGMFDNVRVHYADPRDYLYQYIHNISKENMGIASGYGPDHPLIERLDIILNNLLIVENMIKVHQSIILMIRTDVMEKIINKIKKALESFEKHQKKMSRSKLLRKNARMSRYTEVQMDQMINAYVDRLIETNDLDGLKKIQQTILFFNKLLTRFNVDSVKKLIVDRLSFYILDKMNNLLDMIQNMRQTIDDVRKKIKDNIGFWKVHMAELESSLLVLHNTTLKTYVLIMDIYFLKRMLDKSYIERSILYSGALHSTRIIYCLIRYMGFRLTHIANKNNNTDNEKKITDQIANDKMERMDDVFDMLIKNKLQCTDIYTFPEKFN